MIGASPAPPQRARARPYLLQSVSEPCSATCFYHVTIDDADTSDSPYSISTWSSLEHAMLSRGRQLFGDHPCHLRSLLPRRSCEEIGHVVKSLPPAPDDDEVEGRVGGSNKKKHKRAQVAVTKKGMIT